MAAVIIFIISVIVTTFIVYGDDIIELFQSEETKRRNDSWKNGHPLG